MEKDKYGVHISHCCAYHGCKYNDEACPVESGEVRQEYTCEYCADEGFATVEELYEYQQFLKQVFQSKRNVEENMNVQADLLHRIFRPFRE